MTTYHQPALFVFEPEPPAVERKVSDIRNPPAPPRETGWLKSYISPAVWSLIAEPPRIVHRKQSA